jgi:hypothetical protein
MGNIGNVGIRIVDIVLLSSLTLTGTEEKRMTIDGTVQYLKTTGEPVFVLSYVTEDKVEVRRPIQTENEGIKHCVEEFFVVELESKDEQKAQFIAEREEIIKKYGNKSSSIADFMDRPN